MRGTILNPTLRLYDEPSGRVVCERHAKVPTDIYRWARLSMEDASEWMRLCRDEFGYSEPCEDCRIERGVYR